MGLSRAAPRAHDSALGGLSTTVALLAAVLLATSSLRREAERAREGEPILVVQRLQGGRPALIDPRDLAFLTELPGVRRARPRVWGYVFLPSLRANVTVIGRADELRGGDLGAVRGVSPKGATREKENRTLWSWVRAWRVFCEFRRTMSSAPLAALRCAHAHPGGHFRFTGRGLYERRGPRERERRARILDLPPDRATDVAIDLTSPEEAAVCLSRAIVAHDGGLRIIDKQVTARTSRVTYGRRAGIVLAASSPPSFAC